MNKIENKQLCVAVVDPIVAGVYLGERLKQYNIKSIYIHTLDSLTPEEKSKRFHPENFDQLLCLKDYKNLEDLAQHLKTLNINYVLSGTERSVDYTDQLNALLKLSGNDPNTSSARFDKYVMNEKIRACHLPAVSQIKVNRENLTEATLKELASLKLPVIIKPASASGSVGVSVINDVQEYIPCLKKIPETHQGKPINELVIQEQLTGVEYFVDSLSANGIHQIVSVFRYHKEIINNRPVYRYAEVVHSTEPEYKIAVDYIKKVLSCVGLNNGLGHTEFFLTAMGPRLIEVNPRISGASGMANILVEKTLGTSQVAALAYFLRHQQLDPKIYVPQYYGRFLFIQNWQDRVIGEVAADKLKSLDSYVTMQVLKPAGTYVSTPKSLNDTVLLLALAHKSQEQLIKDCEQVFAWEQNNQLF